MRIILQVFGRLLQDFFIVEPAFCEREKNHKFDSFKSHKNLFFNEVEFYYVRFLHCIKSVCISVGLNMGNCRPE